MIKPTKPDTSRPLKSETKKLEEGVSYYTLQELTKKMEEFAEELGVTVDRLKVSWVEEWYYSSCDVTLALIYYENKQERDARVKEATENLPQYKEDLKKYNAWRKKLEKERELVTNQKRLENAQLKKRELEKEIKRLKRDVS